MSRRRRREEPAASHERWLVSYADFITLLFAFFTTLYAISTVDQKKAGKLQRSMADALRLPEVTPAVRGKTAGGSAPLSVFEHVKETTPAPPPPRLVELERELGEMTDSPSLRGRVRVARDHRGVVISLAEAGFFELGSAEIHDDDLAALDDVAERLLAHDGRERLQLTVEGHTDDRPVRSGRYRSNLELSTARATFVAARLIAHDFAPARVAAAGYGEWRPADSNATAEGRARNRRVDILVQLDATNASEPDGRSR